MRNLPADRSPARSNLSRAAGVLLTLLVLVPAGHGWSTTVAQMLRTELRLQRATVQELVRRLQDAQSQLEDSWSRVDRLALDLARAEQDGEDAQSLASRDADLRDAEGELMMRLFACQRIRAGLAAARDRIASLEKEIERLEAGAEKNRDPISGRWKLVVDPGGLEGEMELNLDGTLINGTYHLQGGWFGSFRGTLVARKVRLERVDSKLGFSSIFYGELTEDDPPRLQGTWEGTHLSSGQPSGGTWVAEKITGTQDNEAAEGYPEP